MRLSTVGVAVNNLDGLRGDAKLDGILQIGMYERILRWRRLQTNEAVGERLDSII